MSSEQNQLDLIEIPFQEISPEALRGVLEEFATRGGFEADTPLARRIEELTQKLKKGKAKIIFNPNDGSTNLVPS